MSKHKKPRSPVIDVQITPEIIDKARRRDSGYCMFAEALKVAFPEATNRISVDLQTVRVSDGKKRLRYIYLTPRSLQTAIVDFDQGIEVNPFSVRLRNAQVLGMSAGKIKKEKRTATQLLLSKTTTRLEPGSPTPSRAGGIAPPAQKTADGIPYSRRREFGLRAFAR